MDLFCRFYICLFLVSFGLKADDSSSQPEITRDVDSYSREALALFNLADEYLLQSIKDSRSKKAATQFLAPVYGTGLALGAFATPFLLRDTSNSVRAFAFCGSFILGVGALVCSPFSMAIGGPRNFLSWRQYKKMQQLVVDVHNTDYQGSAFKSLHKSLKKHYPDPNSFMQLLQRIDLTPESKVIKYNNFKKVIADSSAVPYLEIGEVPIKYVSFYKDPPHLAGRSKGTYETGFQLIAPGGFTKEAEHWNGELAEVKLYDFDHTRLYKKQIEQSIEGEVSREYQSQLSKLNDTLLNDSKNSGEVIDYLHIMGLVVKTIRDRVSEQDDYEVNPDFIAVDPYLKHHFHGVHEIYPEDIENSSWRELQGKLSALLEDSAGKAGIDMLDTVFKVLDNKKSRDVQTSRKRLLRIWDILNKDGSREAELPLFANDLIANSGRCADGISGGLSDLENKYIHNGEKAVGGLGVKISKVLAGMKINAIKYLSNMDSDPEFKTTFVEVMQQRFRLAFGLPIEKREVNYPVFADLNGEKIRDCKIIQDILNGVSISLKRSLPAYNAENIALNLKAAYDRSYTEEKSNLPKLFFQELQDFIQQDSELCHKYLNFVEQISYYSAQKNKWFSLDVDNPSRINFSVEFFKYLAYKFGYLMKVLPR